MSPPMSFAKETHFRSEQFPLRRVLSNHDSGLTDLSLDFFSPQPEKTVYVCGSSDEVSLYHRDNLLTCNPSTVKERVIGVLSSHFYVRSNHGRDQADEKRRKSLHAISNCDVFVFLLSEGILEDVSSISELIFAKLCRKHILSVKEPGFHLDSNARERISHTETSTLLKSQLMLQNLDGKSNDFGGDFLVTENTNIFVPHPEAIDGREKTTGDCHSVPFPLVSVFEELCQDSLVYSSSAHEESVGRLLCKIYDTEEEKVHLPPVIESTSSTSTCGEEVDCELQEKGISDIALMVPLQQQTLSRVSSGYYSSPSPQPLHHVTDTMRTDLDVTTHSVKLAGNDSQISEDSTMADQTTVENNDSADDRLPSIPAATTSSPNTPSVISTSIDHFPVPPPMKPRSRSYETVTNWLNTAAGLHESPTFVETNYLVCPSQPGGPKVKPYLFRFPRDLDTEEQQERRRDSFSTDVTLFHRQSDKVRESSLKDDSPYSTPVASPIPPSDGVPTVSEMKLMNYKPKLPPGVKPRERLVLPVKQNSLPILKSATSSPSPPSSTDVKLPPLPKRSSSVDRNMTLQSVRQTRERKYLKLSTVRLEYSKSR